MKLTAVAVATAALVVAIAAPANAYTRPRPAPRPAPAVTITATEVCGAGGYIDVEGAITSATGGTYDVALSTDAQGQQWVDYVILTPGESYTFAYGLPYGEQAAVSVYDDTTLRQVASREVAAASTCAKPWL